MIFLFFLVRMLYINSNIPKSVFYFALVGELLIIGRSSLLYIDFDEKVKELLNRMKAQGPQLLRCKKSLSKIVRSHEKALVKFRKICNEIFSELKI